MKKELSGFTIIEILVTISLIGILAAIVFSDYQRQIKNSYVRDAAMQFSSDLMRVRNASQNLSLDSSIIILDNKNYQVKIGNNSPENKVLNNDVGIYNYSDGTTPSNITITYTAPYGEIDQSRAFTFKLSQEGYTKMRVGLAGLTGTVIQSVTY